MADRCTICNSENIEVTKFVVGPYIPTPYTLYRCQSCQSSFFDGSEHEFDLKTLYNFDSKNQEAKFSKRSYWTLEVENITEKLASAKPSLRILDIGCRTGDFLLHWDDKHDRQGVELNSHNAEVARKRGLTVHCDFIENIDFEQSFDVITCYALLEHIASPNKLLDKITSLLSDGGILVILIPSIESGLFKKLEKKNMHWHMFTPPEHLSFYSRQFLDNYMEKQNLKLINRRHTSGGMSARYSRLSPFYNLLKNPSHAKVKEYYNTTLTTHSGLLHKIQTIAAVKIEDFFCKKSSFYDHMFSYYQKK